MKALLVELLPAKRVGGLEAATSSLAQALEDAGCRVVRRDESGLSGVELRDYDLAHLHGIWAPSMSWFAARCVGAGVPYVVSTHGMLEPWAFRAKWWKKWPAWFVYQKRCLNRASALHATADSEAENLRALRLTAPIKVIPNGVDLPPPDHSPQVDIAGVRTALFLSRLHPKKGLMDLIQAWDLVRPPGWCLRIHGPDSEGYAARLNDEIRNRGLTNVISVEGAVSGREKWKAYRDADLFVLPTYSENFGLVVAEALASGTPVITTEGAPWNELQEHACGWWIKIGVEPLADALRRATALEREQLAGMGTRGRGLIEGKYTWDVVLREYLAFYSELKGRRSG